MQICNLVLAHKHPHQLNRLLTHLSHPGCQTYVHIDKKSDLQPFKAAVSIFSKVSFIKKRISLHWGGPSMINAVVSSILEIKASGKHFDYINLISGQDFPIRPTGVFVNFLEQNKGKQFISYMEGESAASWWNSGAKRFQKYHFNELNLRYKYLVQHVANKILPERKAPADWHLVGGNCATWWTLTADCAYYLAEQVVSDKKVKDFVKLTWGIDEIIFPTIVMNSPFRDAAVNDNLRYIDWGENQAHPKILQSADYDKIIESSSFFARKFDESVDSEIFERLENQCLKPGRP
ncbi:beta-1,6-N-acetylglucosaminyltransferase [Niabella insulamsoli]|uniref:beta-1,6-N-acetylglucosaminyltransferase n=1 Tax=Niabella insulamsoli TaxID=3144874 RepID=UPI0031FD29D3